MLKNTFIHTPGVGRSTERRIWESGIWDWEEFLEDPGAAGLGPKLTETLEEHLLASLERLDVLDHQFFRRYLPTREHWRVYPAFSEKVAYLDIETTGLYDGDAVTVIGLYDGDRMRAFVRDEERELDLEGSGSGEEGRVTVLPFWEFAEAIDSYGVLVTFYGSGFDLPFLRRQFGDLRASRIHLDLCYLMRQLGFSGGLKRIEQRLGIGRSEETSGLNGWDAVRLWNQYKKGSREALDLLLRYNREDVENLQALLTFATRELQEKIWSEMGALPPLGEG